MSEKKVAKMGVRVFTPRNDDNQIKKSDTSTQITSETLSAGDWLSPRNDLKGLKHLVNESTILPQCIRAYKNNIAGFGIGIRYKEEIEETDATKAEFNKAQEIVDLLTLEQDTKEVFEDVIEARETYGIAYIEVIRNNAGEVAQIEFIPDTQNIVKSKLLEPYVDTVYYYNDKEVKRKRKYRKYRQDIGGQTVYFKEFGDPRIMDKTDGTYFDGENAIDLKNQANEIIEFAIGTEAYGEVRWEGQILGVTGSRQAETLNKNYFDNGRHVPLMIILKNGTLTEESATKLQSYMDNIKGEQGQHAFLLLEEEAVESGTALDANDKPDIEIKELASILQKDELFQEYMDNNRRKVQSAFQLPDIYVGYTTDFNRATAYTAQDVTEKQVFQPERKSLAWVLNNKLLSCYRFKYVEAYFKEPDITNPDDQYKMLSICRQAGGITPNFAKEIAYNAYGRVSEDYEGDWGNIPIGFNQNPSGTTTYDISQIERSLSKQIEKAASNHDDAVVAVMKEVKKLLVKMGDA